MFKRFASKQGWFENFYQKIDEIFWNFILQWLWDVAVKKQILKFWSGIDTLRLPIRDFPLISETSTWVELISTIAWSSGPSIPFWSSTFIWPQNDTSTSTAFGSARSIQLRYLSRGSFLRQLLLHGFCWVRPEQCDGTRTSILEKMQNGGPTPVEWWSPMPVRLPMGHQRPATCCTVVADSGIPLWVLPSRIGENYSTPERKDLRSPHIPVPDTDGTSGIGQYWRCVMFWLWHTRKHVLPVCRYPGIVPASSLSPNKIIVPITGQQSRFVSRLLFFNDRNNCVLR